MTSLMDGVDFRGAISSIKDGKLSSGGDAHFYDDNQAPSKVRSNLSSNKDGDKVKGLKWLLANLSKGKDVSEFFPDVVKNVVVKSVEVKKLVYNYLVHYADFDAACRENSLLSINSFQNDLNGSNQLIRGLALRVMTSIKCLDIIQIQMHAVRKCSVDSSPYVRRCAATALPKIFGYDKSQVDSLKQALRKLMADNSTMVLGQAIASFNEICPTSYDTIHPCLRKICHLLADLDEWTQVSALNMLIRYVRNQFLNPCADDDEKEVNKSRITPLGAAKQEKKRRVVTKKAFYSDDEDESGDEEVVEVGAEKGSVFAEPDADHNLDPDHKLIIRSSTPLLKSRNAGVVIAVCSLHFYCGSRGSQSNIQIGKALVRILRNQREIQYVVLNTIKEIAQVAPSLFVSFLPDFFVKSADPIFNRLLKLDILAMIATKQNIELILRELQVYAKHTNASFVSAAIKTVGKVADIDRDLAAICMDGLIYLLSCSKVPEVVDETLNTLRVMLVQSHEEEDSLNVLKKLIRLLFLDEGAIEVAGGRSNVIWLVGEFLDQLEDVAPDILRLLASGFGEEVTTTKIQILNFAIKLSLKMTEDENVQSLATYVLEMARYDTDTDLRDRSRFMTAMMGLAPSNEANESAEVDEDSLAELAEHASGILLAKKSPPVFTMNQVSVEGMPTFTVGSLSALVGHYANGYGVLTEWPSVQPNPATRDADPEDTNSQFTERIDDKNRAESRDTKPFYDEDSDYDRSESEASSDSDSSDSDSGSDSDSSSENSNSDSATASSSEQDSESESEEGSQESEESEEEVRKPLPIANRQQGRTMKKISKKGSTDSTQSQPISGVAQQPHASPFDLNLLDFTAPSPVQQQQQQPGLMGGGQQQQQQQQQPQGGFDAFDAMEPPVQPIQQMQYGLSNMPQQQQPMMGYPQQQQMYMQQQPGGYGGMMQQPMQQQMQPMMGYPQQQMQSVQGMPMQNQMMQQQMQMQEQHQHQAMTMQASGESHSHPVVLFQPELCSGVSVNLYYRNGAKPAVYANATCANIVFKSTSEQIRRIKLTIPSEIKRTPALEDIPILIPGQEHVHSVEMVLAGVAEGKKQSLIMTCDRGTYNATWIPEMVDLLSPLAVSVDEFLAARTKLTSFHEVSRAFDVSTLSSYSGDLISELSNRVRKIMNTRHINTTQEGEIMFASCFRKGMTEEKVLVSITTGIVSDGISQFSIRLNCDNAAFSNTLMDAFKNKIGK